MDGQIIYHGNQHYLDAANFLEEKMEASNYINVDTTVVEVGRGGHVCTIRYDPQ